MKTLQMMFTLFSSNGNLKFWVLFPIDLKVGQKYPSVQETFHLGNYASECL